MYCRNCGSPAEDHDLFCANCGFSLRTEPIPSHQTNVQTDVVQSRVSQPVEFVSARDVKRPSSVQYYSPCPRNQHSGWILGIVFLGIAFVFALILLIPVIGGFHIDSFGDFFDSIGCTFGSLGGELGNLGGELGNLGGELGNIGGELGSAFGSLGGELGNLGGELGHTFGSFDFKFASMGSALRWTVRILIIAAFVIPGIIFLRSRRRRVIST